MAVLESMAAALSAISAGLGIGAGISNVILKYDKQTYMNRINEVSGYKDQFSTHLDTLTNYRGKLQRAWDDDNAKEYIRQIDTETKAVRNAIEQAQNTINMLNDILQGVNESIGQVQKVEEIKSIVDVLNIVD